MGAQKLFWTKLSSFKVKILAIETSCDETAIALIKAEGCLPIKNQGLETLRFKVLKNFISSQVETHRPFGGVVPNLAKRDHLKNLPLLLKKIQDRRFGPEKIDLLAVTVGPGLEPALWPGINFAKELAKKWHKPLLAVNHLEGHLYSVLLPSKTKSAALQLSIPKIFPAIALIVSGGHTILLKMDSLIKWNKIGETRDDAAGEAFDKVARLLNLPYPGGPEIEKLAKTKGVQPINFPRPMIHHKNYDFSFSGLKTAVLYYLKEQKIKAKNNKLKADVAAGFEQAAIDVLVTKTIQAALEYKANSIFLAGGVAANRALRKTLRKEAQKKNLNFFVPELKFNTDNAAMIAAAAYINLISKTKTLDELRQGEIRSKYKVTAQANLNL